MAQNIDPVDDSDEEDPNPIPDDDGNVILRVPASNKEAANGRRRDNRKGQAARTVAPRRAGTNARKAARPRK